MSESKDQALALMKEFIKTERRYRKTQNPALLLQLKGLAARYKKANGSGDLFSATRSEDLKDKI